MTQSSLPPFEPNDDILWQHLKTLPAFRGVLRAIEARFYRAIDIPEPILDLGCGDGNFAELTFGRPLTVGADPWWGPLKKSQKAGAYHLPVQAYGDRLPFPSNHFNAVISNSVLEHIPDIQPVLNEASRILRPGGQLIITMPSHYFTQYLAGARFFESLGLTGLADQYRRGFNFIARHAHTDSAEVWAQRLATAGFAVERWQYYFSYKALRALEVGHAQGLPSAAMHALTGHWVVAPWQSNLALTERWLRPFYEEPFPEDGTCVFFIARKEADGPIETKLPPAQPFTVAELLDNEAQIPPPRLIETDKKKRLLRRLLN
ncbi:MAG TPA: class I SAM-dependent methyltransferase [Anaerolineae bacterium]|nr:class I SAM-dependent methyltransferase [Anaerolineae bacterium]